MRTLSISLAEKKRKEATLLTAFLSVVNLLFRRRIVKLKSITLNGVFTRHSLIKPEIIDLLKGPRGHARENHCGGRRG